MSLNSALHNTCLIVHTKHNTYKHFASYDLSVQVPTVYRFDIVRAKFSVCDCVIVWGLESIAGGVKYTYTTFSNMRINLHSGVMTRRVF